MHQRKIVGPMYYHYIVEYEKKQQQDLTEDTCRHYNRVFTLYMSSYDE